MFRSKKEQEQENLIRELRTQLALISGTQGSFKQDGYAQNQASRPYSNHSVQEPMETEVVNAFKKEEKEQKHPPFFKEDEPTIEDYLISIYIDLQKIKDYLIPEDEGESVEESPSEKPKKK